MLETVDLGKNPKIKQDYKTLHKELMQRLVVLQQKAITCGAGLVVLFEGWDAAGKGSRISDLLYFLDARSTKVHVTCNVNKSRQKQLAKLNSGVVSMQPTMQEFWEALGQRGHITFFDQGWYSKYAQELLYSEKTKREDMFSHALDSIKSFEKQLTDDGYIIVKFFLHISKNTQLKRIKKLASNEKTSWRVDKDKLKVNKIYERAFTAFDKMLEESDFSFAPWTLVNAEDKKSANIKIMQTLVTSLEEAINNNKRNNTMRKIVDNDTKSLSAQQIAQAQHLLSPQTSKFKIVKHFPKLSEISNDLILLDNEYKLKLKSFQKEIFELENEIYKKRIPAIIMFEGWDAAGKGGAIKRLAQSLDARSYEIFTSAAPTKQELDHPHLWRYWTRLPKAGHVGIYDRSWYGRVLVERVEEITNANTWARGYDEINEFEYDLINWGAILIKFWINISQEEQLSRFKDRQNNPQKQWKITDEDWRNRDKFVQYAQALDDMFRLTSTEFAPWAVIEGDNKFYARIKVLKCVRDSFKARLKNAE